MTDVIRHRGPDDLGFFIDDHIMLGQCRLSIIDLKTGRQPIYNEDRSIVIVYNGEIYNFKELRNELEKVGHSFSTNSDTEVVVHAYEEFGLKCFDRFNGMFAFALYDANTNQLILARDRQGIKPLYYTVLDRNLIFASEIKAILQFPGIQKTLDVSALACFLTLRYVPLDATLFSGIRKLLPGHYIVIDKSGCREVCYWQLRPYPGNDGVAKANLLDIMKRSVQRHLISDVPIGVYLSGGLDSAAMVAFASKLSDRPVNTFCMGFGEQSDELDDARVISEHFGTIHHETVVEGSLLTEFPEMIWHMDFPKRNLYPYYLARLASERVKVVLSGLGGDELFGGYDFRYSALLSRNPANVQDKVKAYFGTQARDVPSDQSAVYGQGVPTHDYECSYKFLSRFFDNSLPFMEQVLAADFNGKMIYDFLPVDDSTSMAHSVETRVPFLDNELVDLAFAMPFASKFHDGKGKWPLREALASELPRSALEKKKQGFGPNPYEIYRKELRSYAENYLLGGHAVKMSLLNQEWIRRVLTATPSPDLASEYNKLWDCLALEVFLRIYFDGPVKDLITWDNL
jgi:asparagine synthase (glutamine-hydrolysing)